MNTHGVDPKGDDFSRSGDDREQVSFPRSTAADDLQGALKRLVQLAFYDRKSNTFSVERLILSLSALQEVESKYRLCHIRDGRGAEALRPVFEEMSAVTHKLLSELRARKKDVLPGHVQLCGIVADKLASIWAQYFVPTDGQGEILKIAKDLVGILNLGKLTNIDELPERINNAQHLAPLERFGLWGVAHAYFAVIAGDSGVSSSREKALNCSFTKAQAALKLTEAPPSELALLSSFSDNRDERASFQVASTLLLESVSSAAERLRDRGNIVRAQRVAELVVPFIDRLSLEQLRSWLTDYSLTCAQAQRQGDHDFAKQMWERLEELTHGRGDEVAVESLRFTARRIKSDMRLGEWNSSQQGVDGFRKRFEKLQPDARQELYADAMTVGQAAISLLLREARETSFNEQAKGLLSDACKEVDALASMAEFAPLNGSFMVIESLLDIAESYLDYDEVDDAHDHALRLWQRARTLLDETEEPCTDGVLYQVTVCRTWLAEVATLFEDPEIRVSQEGGLLRMLIPLTATIESDDVKDYERSSYQYAQLELLRVLAGIQCSLDGMALGRGVETILQALSLYRSYSLSDTDNSLIRSLYKVAIDVHERNYRHDQATQFRQKLDRLG
jgi:hypothetical protein